MTLARCPACQTVFRLRPEQLHAQGGKVRCGRCLRPFDAVAHKIAPDTASAAEAPGVLRRRRHPPAPAATPEPVSDPASPLPGPQSGRRTPQPESGPPPLSPAERPAPPEPPRPQPRVRGRPQRPSPLVRIATTLALVLLTGTLGAQLLYLFRAEIARDLPGLRPLLASACARAGCTLPYPRDAQRIAIEATELQEEPGRPGEFVLYATINNRADYAQDWPHLELTLNDAADQALARRVLPPRDWLPPDHPAEAFPGRSALGIRLPFSTPDMAPVGYRLYVFYP
ncbi:MJ0042 family finger-like domain-containing protein [Thauera chlorobenzoica]|nr:MJ0042 family finger-like domain-containing protein [Thauera chlorobenzoica]